tara:strand:- start:691 stop:975 length:285 start_codon:yes stop_codon:yes gene_type:complete
MKTELATYWNNLTRSQKLDIIENGIFLADVSEGFLMLRLYRNGNTISCQIQDKLDNHLCSEVVSQSTLSELFSDTHDFVKEDAEVILNWMEAQK